MRPHGRSVGQRSAASQAGTVAANARRRARSTVAHARTYPTHPRAKSDSDVSGGRRNNNNFMRFIFIV